MRGGAGGDSDGRWAHAAYEEEEDDDYGWDRPERDDFWSRKKKGKAREQARRMLGCDPAED